MRNLGGLDTSSAFKTIDAGRYSVTGDLTFASVPELWEQSGESLLESQEQRVEIDIGAAEHFDSGGLALLVAWSRWAYCNKRELLFRNATEKAQNLVAINKLQDLLKLC
jgi:phospholipid transport system transporter-binding protein